MIEFLQANWLWLLVGAGVLWFLFRQGGCAMGSHESRSSESSQVKEASRDEEHSSHVKEQPGHHQARRRGHGCC